MLSPRDGQPTVLLAGELGAREQTIAIRGPLGALPAAALAFGRRVLLAVGDERLFEKRFTARDGSDGDTVSVGRWIQAHEPA